MKTQSYEIGMVGLGVMGRNLLLNMAEHGFSVAGYDRDPSKVDALRQEANERDIGCAADIQDFIPMLRPPRAVMMLVPAGAPVDSVIHDLQEHLQPGDLIIDGGNSYYKDTDVRTCNLAEKRIQFLGVGISGGEEGARHGPSIMPGGPRDAYERVRPVLEAVAAKVNDEPCVTWLGPRSAGHFVKMVHNGIEYGVMELLAESYDLMKRGLGLSDDELASTYAAWNEGELNSYLVEIASEIFRKTDQRTGKRLIDVILDVAKQKGTGMWTSQSAMELQVPAPTIDAAVAMRDLSVFEMERQRASVVLHRPMPKFGGDRETFLTQLRHALHVGMIVTYAQGFALLSTASSQYRYYLDLKSVARIWRGGCIIRAALLEDIRSAFRANHELPNLLLDPEFSKRVVAGQEDLRHVVGAAADMGLPALGLMSVLGYLDGYRSSWLPANLIQAQRDYFGSHTYERVDSKGSFHTQWKEGIAKS